MKTGLHILVIAFMACFVAACGSHADRASLVAIDSLILQDPDSACGMLAAYPADSLTTAADRAYHALLTTIADYKAYRPATTDSAINIAVSHYDHDGSNPDHRMRSLLYKGCVMEELGDPEQAIEYYKRAETNCPADDHFNIGYINFRKALIYQSAYVDSIPTECYKNAIQAFRTIGNKQYEAKALNSFGALYLYSNPDSALLMVKQSIGLAQDINDSLNIVNGYNSLCAVLYYRKDYTGITELAKQHLIPSPNDNNRATYDKVSISFSKQGDLNAAKKLLQVAPPACTVEDTISQLRALSEFELASGDTQKYILHNGIAVDKSDSLLLTSQADKIKEAEAKYDLAQNEVVHLTRQREMTIIISILALVVIVVSFVVYIQRKRIARVKKENETAQIQLSALKIQIADSLKHIEALNQQQETSPSEEQLTMLMQSIEGSLACYSSLLTNLLKQMKATSKEKNTKLAAIMDEDFFAQLRLYVNLRYDNLIDKLVNGDYNLNTEEINIICLELCRFPNLIQWAHSNCDRYKSLLNKKKIIANKVNGSDSIAAIPQNI